MDAGGLEIRPITDGEVEAFRDCVMTTFGHDREDDPEGPQRVRALIPPGRAWAAFDRGAVVATAATFALTLGVPGGALPIAGLTMVAVRPTHRRRGLMRALIERHLADARAHGEPVSALWASEGSIYGRFGYGVATESDELVLDARGLEFLAHAGEPDAPVWIEHDEAIARLPEIYARAAAGRPGALRRTEAWWRWRRFSESPFMRGGATLRRHVVVERAGQDVGYVVYRQRAGAADDFPGGTAEIVELIAVDARAEASLWRFVAGIDLFPRVKWWNAPTDSVLPWIVSDPRRASRKRADAVWLRVDDVAAALAARRYLADGALRFSIEGRADTAAWELRCEAGVGQCAPARGAAELALAPSALGSLLLGGVTASQLARAGLVRGSDEAVLRADRLLGWPVAPWCPEVF